MEFQPIILQGFQGREESLKNIKRYIHHITPVMYYRTNDLIHSKRVLWHLEEAIPKIKKVYETKFEVNFARTLALVHDDVEILTGDVQLHDKEKMNTKELETLVKDEKEAIKKIVKMYSQNANGESYEELLLAAKEKTSLEAQFVSFFDKFDGAGEAWHEVWAGNNYFSLPAGGNEGTQGGYIRRLNEFSKKYVQMTEFFNKFPEYLPLPFNFKEVSKKAIPHTKESLEKDSGYLPYERWKRTVIKNEGLDNLLTQKEF